MNALNSCIWIVSYIIFHEIEYSYRKIVPAQTDENLPLVLESGTPATLVQHLRRELVDLVDEPGLKRQELLRVGSVHVPRRELGKGCRECGGNVSGEVDVVHELDFGENLPEQFLDHAVALFVGSEGLVLLKRLPN